MRSALLVPFSIIVLISACGPRKTVTKVDHQPAVPEVAKAVYNGPKKKVAIARFENATRFGQRRLGDHISDVLATELDKTNRFILLDRENVDKILEQVALSQSGLTEGDLNQIQLIDADFLLTGTVTHYAVTTTGSSNIFRKTKTQKAEVAADVRLINTRNGEIVLSKSGRGLAERQFKQVMGMGETGGYDESLEMDAFRAAVIDVTENILKVIDEIPWSCDVVEIAGTKLYINAGKKSNIKIGDFMDVYQQAKLIKNLSGTIIGYEEKLITSGEVTNYVGEDGAVLQIEAGLILQMPLVCRFHANRE
jgi:curli biogenesis system outer membrane secretion channel CsgG